MARDFDRQVAEFQVRDAVLNGYTARGIPVTKIAGQVCQRTGAVRLSPGQQRMRRKAPGDQRAVDGGRLVG
jgi:hypothetical protein